MNRSRSLNRNKDRSCYRKCLRIMGQKYSGGGDITPTTQHSIRRRLVLVAGILSLPESLSFLQCGFSIRQCSVCGCYVARDFFPLVLSHEHQINTGFLTLMCYGTRHFLSAGAQMRGIAIRRGDRLEVKIEVKAARLDTRVGLGWSYNNSRSRGIGDKIQFGVTASGIYVGVRKIEVKKRESNIGIGKWSRYLSLQLSIQQRFWL